VKHDGKSKAALLETIASLELALSKSANAEARRQEAETKLEVSEARYRALTDNLPLGIYRRTCGPAGKLVMVNPALVRMFKYDSASELHEVPVAKLYYHPGECDRFSEKLFTHGEVIREELKMKRRDGVPIWIAVTARVIGDRAGAPQFFDGIMEDITERKRAEKEEKERQAQLVQADKMISLGILVSGVAHEINNPNQFIVSHIAPLRKAWEDALPILSRYQEENGDFLLGGQRFSLLKRRIPDMFHNIREGTDRIAHIVAELRDYAREHPADLTQPADLNDVIRSALALLQSLIKKSASQFYATYGKALPRFKGSYRQIEQVVINLIQNACQALQATARQDGKISISTSYDKGHEQILFQVNDTGCGIPEEHLGRITDPFFTTKRGAGGTGLGLSISETIVANHGGHLTFSSKVGEGCTVKMYLPAMAP
jgi:two-component system NtrC family sensor kinase